MEKCIANNVPKAWSVPDLAADAYVAAGGAVVAAVSTYQRAVAAGKANVAAASASAATHDLFIRRLSTQPVG